MPKLPTQETKASAAAATMDGVISGRMTVRSTVNQPAPPALAASTSSRGSLRRPARTSRKTSGPYWMPSKRMMPPGE